jgi:hypothetical protein
VSEEWLGNLLAALISLRVFKLNFSLDLHLAPDMFGSKEAHHRFVQNVTHRTPHLEYFAVSWDSDDYLWKRVHGEWVPCDIAELPLNTQLTACLY